MHLRIHHRLCRFELLEPRQVLSVTLTPDIAAALSNTSHLQLDKARTHQSAAPVGLTPFQLQSAYGFYTGTQADFGNQYDASGKLLKKGTFNNNIHLTGNIIGDGSGQTIAIIDSGNSPTIVNDLKAFSLQFGLPLMNVAGGPTFKVVNQTGSSNPLTLPFDDVDSSVETALDVQWVHAIAPNANILLVECNDPFAPFSGGAVDGAALMQGNIYARSVPGVTVISNSWGGGEGLGENALDYVFSTPPAHVGETFVFSAGDSGGPASYPSASPNVLSVGGTKLTLSLTNKYAGEMVWNEAAKGEGAGGGGESGVLFQDPSGRIFLQPGAPLEPVPTFQKNVLINGAPLTGRGTPDVSWNGDPESGFAVYDSFAFGTATPWEKIGGTSAGAPQWSALLSIANQGRKLAGKGSLSNAQAIMYSLPSSDFHDIKVGNNDYFGLGFGLTGNPATVGYDLASGLGTPVANLVIRDLVAASGISFVSAPFSAGGSTLSGFFRTKKVHLAAGFDAGETVGGAEFSESATTDSSPNPPSSTQLGSRSEAIEPSVAGVEPVAAPLGIANPSPDGASPLALHGHRARHSVATDPAQMLDSYFSALDGSAD